MSAHARIAVSGGNQATKLRVFAGSSSTTAAQVFAASEMSAVGNFFTGKLSYSTLSVSIDGSKFSGFSINTHPHQTGSSEYGTALEYKNANVKEFNGNYGVMYKLTIAGAANKTLKLAPTSADAFHTVAYRVNNGSWTASPVVAGPTTINIPLGSSSSSTVDIITSGGTHTHKDCTIV